MADETHYPCPECQLGVLRPRRAAYFTVQGGQTVSVPDFPAWVCDVCGRREYDAAALAELRLMLNSGRRPRRGHRPRRGRGPDPARDQGEARRRP